MFDWLENIDRELFLVLNNVHAPWLDKVMWYISYTPSWIPLFLFFAFYAYKKNGKKFLVTILLSAGLCIALADLISVHLFKEVFQRYRPTHNEELKGIVKIVTKPNGEVYLGGLYSLVSSHAANFGAISMLLFLNFKKFSKWWVLLFIWFTLIVYSRIYLGVHYPSDIFVGGLLGFTIGYGVYKLQQLILRKIKTQTKMSKNG